MSITLILSKSFNDKSGFNKDTKHDLEKKSYSKVVIIHRDIVFMNYKLS